MFHKHQHFSFCFFFFFIFEKTRLVISCKIAAVVTGPSREKIFDYCNNLKYWDSPLQTV